MSEIIPQALRDNLKIRKQVLSGETWFVVKDPEKQEYYRFDDGQYGLMALFDGVADLRTLTGRFNAASREWEYDYEDAVELYNSVRGSGLLARTREEENAALIERLRETRKQKFLQRQGSLMYMRFHAYDPDELFDRLLPALRFMWKPATVRICLGLMVAALVVCFLEHKRFAADFMEVSAFVFGSVEGLLTAWPLILVVIALHEFAHGLTCKNFGGEVHDMGFLVMLLINPCMYCNINDAWLFDNKRHKMYTVMAGIYFELLLGSLAVMVWSVTDVGSTVGRLAFTIITVCISATVLFNLNPLMKLDGYYLLSDYLELPNLRQNALGLMSWTLKRHVLRLDEPPPMRPTGRERRIFLTYGGTMTLYLGTVFTKLFQMGYGFVKGIGFFAVLAFLFVAFKFFKGVLGTWPGAVAGVFHDRLWAGRRRNYTLGALALFLLAAALWTPHMRVGAPCALDARSLVLHAPESGFVTAVGYGADRFPVGDGAPLVVMQSLELDMERAVFAADREGLAQERRMAGAAGESAAGRRVAVRENALRAKGGALSKRASALSVAFPQGRWRVDGPPPEVLHGRYYPKGEAIVTLVPEDVRTVNITLEQQDLSYVRPGDQVRVMLPGRSGLLEGAVRRIAEVGLEGGVVRQFEVRAFVRIPQGEAAPPVGMEGKAVIYGEQRALWEHLLRPIKRMTRFDLWL